MHTVSPTRRHLIAVTAAGLLASRLPRVGHAQDASPIPAGADDGSLPAMLARVYDPIPDGGTGPSTLLTYANIARQLEVRGLRGLDAALEDDDRLSEWIDGVDGLYLDNIIAERTFQAEFWEMVGFGPADIAQTMTIGDPPGITRIYRGDFDGAAIQRALESAGYEPIETDRGSVLSIGQDGEFAADNPIQVVAISAYNNIAIVDDSYLIASPFIVNVESALAVFAGSEATLANNRAVDTLMSAIEDELVTATILDGSVLSVANLPDFAREGGPTPVAAETIPPVVYALFGLTPGSMPSRYKDEDPQLQGDNDDTIPRSAFVIGLHLGSVEEAAAAVPVIQARFDGGVSVLNGQAYADLLGEAEVTAVAEAPVVTIRITGDRVGRIWLRVVFGLDLAFIYTE